MQHLNNNACAYVAKRQWSLFCHASALKLIVYCLSIIGTLCCVAALAESKANLSEAGIKAQYLYNFIDLTTWPEEKKKSRFVIGFFGENTALKREFDKLSPGNKIRGKNITTRVIKHLDALHSIDALVLSKKKSLSLSEVASRAIKTETLLISDMATDKKSIMINFKQPEAEYLHFEVNRSNLIYEGLTISSNIVLLGGTEIDIAHLYKEMEFSLNQSRQDLAAKLQEIKRQEKNIKKSHSELKTSKAELASNKKALLDQQQQLQQYEGIIDSHKQTLAREKYEADSVLQKKAGEIQKLETDIKHNSAVLNQQIKDIAIQKYLLKQKDVTVEKLGSKLATQQKLLFGGLALFIVIILLLASLLANFRRRHELAHEREMRETMESSLKLKSDFISAISHELRTPMHGILGGLQIIQKNPDEQLRSPLGLVQKSAVDLMRLINDILAYTELKAWSLKSIPKNSHMRPILSKLESRYRERCEQKNLSFEWIVDEALPPYLRFEKDKFVTILDRLLDNAVKFTDKGSIKVIITMSDTASSSPMLVHIEDTGIGIKQADKDSIYEAFQQVDSGFERRYGGLGIGLCIVGQLLASIKGSIKLVSELGKGSCFSLTIPVEIGETDLAKDKKTLLSAELPILVVEDNMINQKVMVKMLEKLGFQSLIANHGEEALSLLRQDKASLILMDLQMPVMDGFSCTQHIRATASDYQEIPIIAVTANLMEADKAHCQEVGMNDYLAKPVALTDLKDCLSNYIECPHIASDDAI